MDYSEKAAKLSDRELADLLIIMCDNDSTINPQLEHEAVLRESALRLRIANCPGDLARLPDAEEADYDEWCGTE